MSFSASNNFIIVVTVVVPRVCVPVRSLVFVCVPVRSAVTSERIVFS